SPYAPKLLLAIARAADFPADSLARLLNERYATNPYVLVLRGADDPGYRALEDSLYRFASLDRIPPRAPPRSPGRGVRPVVSPTPAAPVQ
ncbi:MAG: hypothetical protein JF590_06045, partial [Gemmatimonadetes bacterium]|nr:hypothetical protein [Gemmatimonadota bacterium]